VIRQREFTTPNPMNNVRDEFKGMYPEEIREKLAPLRTDLVNVCLHRTKDFNKSSVLRAGNAFLASEFILVGAGHIDARGMLGLHHLENFKRADNLEETVAYLHERDYKVYAVVGEVADTVLYDEIFPVKTAFVYGEEGYPLAPEDIQLCDASISIPQRGVDRNLNTAQNGAVFMAEYSRQHRV